MVDNVWSNRDSLGCELMIRGVPVSDMMLDRFCQKVNKAGADECWPWAGAKNQYGVGMFSGGNQAPRVSWMLANGASNPVGLVVIHTCNNPACVNPRHLQLGTRKENIQNERARGRRTHATGKDVKSSKLTDDDARNIREKYNSGAASMRQLASLYGVSQPVIWSVVHNRTWKHAG